MKGSSTQKVARKGIRCQYATELQIHITRNSGGAAPEQAGKRGTGLYILSKRARIGCRGPPASEAQVRDYRSLKREV